MLNTASDEYGTIRLGSESLEWSSRPPSLAASTNSSGTTENTSEHFNAHPRDFRNSSPFFGVDADNMEACGFSEGVKLSAARLFDLAVVGTARATIGADAEERNIVQVEGNTGANHEAGKIEGLAQGRGLNGTASGLEAALLRGDTESLNASAGVVNVKVTTWRTSVADMT